jgi:hypothetical protein
MSEIRIDPATDLANIIKSLPHGWDKDALSYACVGIGKLPKPTGLQPNRTRTLGHLFWDYSSQDLIQRIQTLGHKEKIDTAFMIIGLCSFLINRLKVFASPELAALSVEQYRRMLFSLDNERNLPIDDRQQCMSGSELDDFIQKIQNSIDNAEQTRFYAKEALDVFVAAVSDRFTEYYWEQFNGQQLIEGSNCNGTEFI